MQILVPSAARLGESPLWCPEERALYWLDLLQPALHRWHAADGHRRLPLDAPPPLGAIVRTPSPGTALLAAADGLALLDLATGRTRPLSRPLARLPHLNFNDGKADRMGRLWLGTADEQELDPRGILYLIDRGVPEVADAGFAVCNGPAFSPDGSVLYFSDSNSRTILSYRVDADAVLHDRRVFTRFAPDEGYPDGLTVDADGFLWVAHWAGARVSRFSPAGHLDRVLRVPAPNVTSVAFGGDDLGTLFITTATEGLDAGTLEAFPHSGGLFCETETGVRGRVEPAWNGPDA